MGKKHFIYDVIKKAHNDLSKPATPEVNTIKKNNITSLKQAVKYLKNKEFRENQLYKENAAKISAKVDTEASTPAKSKSKKDLKIRTAGYTSMYQGSGRNLV